MANIGAGTKPAGRPMYKEENVQKLIEMYNQNYTFMQIAAAIGVSEMAISYKVRRLRKEGKLEQRIPVKLKEKDRKRNAILEKYHEGLNIQEIAEEVGVSVSLTNIYLHEWADKGEIPSDWLERMKDNAKNREDKPIEEGVRCTSAISKRCVYGVAKESQSSGLCRYIQCTNHMRGCSWKHCTQFVEMDKEHPRAEISDQTYQPVGIIRFSDPKV